MEHTNNNLKQISQEMKEALVLVTVDYIRSIYRLGERRIGFPENSVNEVINNLIK